MRDAHRLISISNRSAATYCYVARVAPAERAHQPTIEEIMQVTRRGSIGVALALGLTAVSGAAQAAMSCDSLTTVTPEASTIARAATPAQRRTHAWHRTSVTASSPPAATWDTTAARRRAGR